MEVVFNELSFTKVTSEQAANDCYERFFKHCLAIEKLSLTDLLKIITIDTIDIFGEEIYDEISFRSWLERLPVKFDAEKTLIYKILADSKKAINYPEYQYENNEAKGLGLAYENEQLAISFQTNEKWNKKDIEILKAEIDEKKGFLNENVVKVRHTGCKEHTINYKIWNEANFTNQKAKVLHEKKDKSDEKRYETLMAQTGKLLFPQKKASDELVNEVIIETIGKIENWDDFYKKLVTEDVGIRISIYERIYEDLMEINGWMTNSKLTKRNKRNIYQARKLYAALDTQHGTLEIHDSKGNHKGEYRFSGVFEKYSKHTLDV